METPLDKKHSFTKKETDEISKSLRFHLNESMTNIFTMPKELRDNILMEGYYMTYPVQKVKRFLQKRYGESAIVETFVGDNDVEMFRVAVYNTEDNKKIVDKDMMLCGYYPSSVTTSPENSTLFIVYEPRNQKAVTEYVKRKGRIYHITKKSVLEKIQKIGLCPRTKNKMFHYPERVYFLLDKLTGAGANDFIGQLMRNDEANTREDTYVLLRIETKGLDIDFFFDPNARNCVYTKENIPPEFITVEKEY